MPLNPNKKKKSTDWSKQQLCLKSAEIKTFHHKYCTRFFFFFYCISSARLWYNNDIPYNYIKRWSKSAQYTGACAGSSYADLYFICKRSYKVKHANFQVSHTASNNNNHIGNLCS